VRVGNAHDLLQKTPGKFDLIFNDVDKHQYPDSLRVALPKLRRGGLFITDNTLWSGKAARPTAPDDIHTQGIQEFNRLVYASKELYPVLIRCATASPFAENNNLSLRPRTSRGTRCTRRQRIL